MSSFVVNMLVIVCAIGLIIWGKTLRDKKSSKGISASSNDTSTGTALMVCGALLFLSHLVQVVESLA